MDELGVWLNNRQEKKKKKHLPKPTTAWKCGTS
jgi:hypothetical protein